MERILLRNGIPEPMPRIEGTYLYQTLHVRGRRPLWLDRHTELLARNIQELFSCAGPPTFADWRHRSPLCSTPTVTPSQALRSYAWPSHRRATCC